MFTEPTVFILGAGASWHYGYPTGEDLIIRIIQKADNLIKLFEISKINQNYRNLPEFIKNKYTLPNTRNETDQIHDDIIGKLQTFVKLLNQNNYLVIDYFLQRHPACAEIGKWLIALVIMESACNLSRYKGNYNRKLILQNSPLIDIQEKSNNIRDSDLRKFDDDWFKFIQAKITSGCGDKPSRIQENKVNFITFNYDWSIERCLERLTKIEFFGKEIVECFTKQPERVLHVYGNIPYDLQNVARTYVAVKKKSVEDKEFLDLAWNASQNIKTIPEAKKNNNDTLKKAKLIIEKAKHIYIFGYGFDESNNENLNLQPLFHPNSRKHIFFTNYNDYNKINKRAAKLFQIGAEDVFIEKCIPESQNPVVKREENNCYYEKSIKDVYGALAYDFDL